MKKQSKAMSWLLKSAVVAVPLVLWSATAQGQYRVQSNNGHALDANPRLGSGGYNSGSDLPPPVSGNDIVTGNVTGLRYFHGTIDYTDPRAFRGYAPGLQNPSDALIRTAGDQPTPDNTAPGYQPEGRIFYGQGRFVAPPPDYRLIAPGTPGYISSRQVHPRSVADARLGDISHGQVVDTPAPSQLVLQGPTNKEGQPSIITASPLFGIRLAMPQDKSLLPWQNDRDLLGLDDATLHRMRAEIEHSATAVSDQNRTGANSNTAADKNTLSLTSPINNRVPASTVQNQSVGGLVGRSAIGEGSNQGIQQNFIVPPEDQNKQYALMLKKYQKLEAENKMTPEQRAQAYNAVMRARTREQPGANTAPNSVLPAPGTPAQQNPSPQAGQPRTRSPSTQPAPPSLKTFEPVQVNSLAEGMTGKGLTELTKQAEDLVRQGKYTEALEKYDAADTVTPNNPMVKLGRAIAELGGAYYARADLHLRDAFAQSPALMVAKFNLQKLLGRDRIQSLVRDLRDLATQQKKDPRPVFLLAFIAYNTGSPETANAYLDLARKRSDNKDPLLKSLQEHWLLSESPQLNK